MLKNILVVQRLNGFLNSFFKFKNATIFFKFKNGTIFFKFKIGTIVLKNWNYSLSSKMELLF